MASICFVSFYSGSLLFPGKHATVGGAEVQQHLLALALEKVGLRISYIVGDDPETRGLVHTRFPVFRSYNRLKGVRYLRFLYPQFVQTWRALKRANCDYYYVRGMRVESGITMIYCLIHRRKYISAIAHDRECNVRTLPGGRWNFKTILFVLGLKQAFRVFAQTSWQKAALEKSFGVEAHLIRNTMSVDESYREPAVEIRRVLWVGTIVPHKRPEIFLGLAKRFPDLEFTMIGPLRIGLEEYQARIKSLASKIPNLVYIDYVDLNNIEAFFMKADLFVLTSNSEGFPNVLLHALSCGRPVVTSCDPDSIVATHRLGYVTVDEPQFAEVLDMVKSARCVSELREMSERGRSYVKKFHSPDEIARRICLALGIRESKGSIEPSDRT